MCVNGECVCDQKLPEGAECGRNSCGALVGCGIMKECRYGKCERIPDCQLKNKECGDDGIGGSCGTCKEGQQCVNGKCVCKPECGDRECGDDGCGGSCGNCDYCVEGVCLRRVEHPYRLFPKRVLQGGNAIFSPNGAYALIFFEGTLILNTKPGSFIEGKTKSSRTVARYAAMRKDGNFVVYTDEWYPQWQSNTFVPNSHVEITNEGKLLIVDEEGKVVWDNDDEKIDRKNRLI